MKLLKIILLVVELALGVVFGVFGTVLFWMGFIALAGGQYVLSGLPFGALACLVFLAVVYERKRGKNARAAKETR